MLVFAARNLVNQQTEEDDRNSNGEIHRTVCSPDSLYSKLGDLASNDIYLLYLCGILMIYDDILYCNNIILKMASGFSEHVPF